MVWSMDLAKRVLVLVPGRDDDLPTSDKLSPGKKQLLRTNYFPLVAVPVLWALNNVF
jgi:hypothetical protein